MSLDRTRSPAELMGLPLDASARGLNSLAAENRRWLTMPLEQLPPEGVWHLMKLRLAGPSLAPLALDHLDRDPGLFGLLVTVLDEADYPWADDPDSVRRLRGIVESALRDLDEWDGSEAIVIEAMTHKIPILRAWASFEYSLSRIP